MSNMGESKTPPLLPEICSIGSGKGRMNKQGCVSIFSVRMAPLSNTNNNNLESYFFQVESPLGSHTGIGPGGQCALTGSALSSLTRLQRGEYLSLSLYIYIYICIYTCTLMYTYIYIYIYTYLDLCFSLSLSIYLSLYIYIYIYIYMYVNTHIYIYIYMRIYLSLSLYIYIYMYTYTYIHITYPYI